MNKHIGCKDQRLLFFHQSMELMAVGNVFRVPAAVPRWQRRQGIRSVAALDGSWQDVAKSSRHKGGHRCAAPGDLITQALHDAIVTVNDRLQVNIHITRAK